MNRRLILLALPLLLPAPLLAATFADGTESPHSAPFDFSDTVPAPVLIKITR